MKTIVFLMILPALFFNAMAAGAWADEWQTRTARELMQHFQKSAAGVADRSGDPRSDFHSAMIRFYQVRDFRLAWVDRFGLRSEGAMALAAVHQAGDQGLLYEDYRNPWLEELLGGTVSRPVIIGADFEGQQIPFDLAVTEMALRYAWDLTQGRTVPDMINYGLPVENNSIGDLAVALAESLDSGRPEEFWVQLGPRHAAYRALQQSLPRYRRIKRAGGWSVIDEGPTLQSGDCGPRVAQLRKRLVVSGDIRPALQGRGYCFDNALADAVERFQRRHGLNADGVAGARTLTALNVPVEQRIHQIELSLERWRWLPADLGSRYVLVNIPGYQMQMVEAGRAVKTMRTIVGRKRRPTPVLTSMITYLEINPYWYVPPKIAREDLLPKIQANPDFIVRQNFRVFDGWKDGARELNPSAIDWSTLSEDHFPYRLRQEPAAHNALGRVKFMFPNELSVYIHDTPSKGLFRKPSRPFSSGCVRLEEPLALVSLLLDRQDWDQERLAQAVTSNQRQVVTLEEPVPVYLVYFTAWAAVDGELHFREDIYGHDQTLLSTLATGTRTAWRHPAYAGFRMIRKRL